MKTMLGDKTYRISVVIILTIHGLLLAYGASIHSPTQDELGHLPAGVSHWQTGTFFLYRVNPPLVRMIAALPVLISGADFDWSGIDEDPNFRPEFDLGADFIKRGGDRAFRIFTFARLVCIPFSFIGAIVCWRWAVELYGRAAGLLAMILWCSCPNIIAHGQMITPDVAAASLGVLAAYSFRRWLNNPGWLSALVAGLVLGIAQLSKTTLVFFIPLFSAIWLASCWAPRLSPAIPSRKIQLVQVGMILMVCLYIINLGYGFDGSFCRLGDFDFISSTLGGPPQPFEGRITGRVPGNIFRNTWISHLPIPLPREYVRGVDVQKAGFESSSYNYLRGEWKVGGWWYYYFYATLVKVPLGTLLLLALSASLTLAAKRAYRGSLLDETLLISPIVLVMALTAFQSGINRHFRYALPVFPFVFVFISRVARPAKPGHGWVPCVALAAIVASVVSMSASYPHSLSYFNELVGGPAGGQFHLLGSNLDWNQDLLLLRRWVDHHPEAQPLGIAYGRSVHPTFAGLSDAMVPANVLERSPLRSGETGGGMPLDSTPKVADALGNTGRGGDSSPTRLDLYRSGPQPGWFAIGINYIYARKGGYRYFENFEPVDRIGYSIYVFNISRDQANDVRRRLGLPMLELPATQTIPTTNPGD